MVKFITSTLSLWNADQNDYQIYIIYIKSMVQIASPKSSLSICHAHSICTSVICINVFLSLECPNYTLFHVHVVNGNSSSENNAIMRVSLCPRTFTPRRQKYTWLQLKYHEGILQNKVINTITKWIQSIVSMPVHSLGH